MKIFCGGKSRSMKTGQSVRGIVFGWNAMSRETA
jgi:hypothetical protein